MDLRIAGFGLVAGLLTTISGLGGGVLLILALSALHGARSALVMSAPALLLGNLHRAFLCRQHIDRSVARALILGAVPGSLMGGWLAGRAPEPILDAFLLLTTALALGRATGLVRFNVPRSALTLAGAGVGALAGTGGGAGLLLSPLLLTTGLSGRRYVGTAAAVAVSMHVGRVIAYAQAGLFRTELAAPTATLAMAIFVGNLLGDWVSPKLGHRLGARLEYGVLLTCIGLAVSGVSR